jgi:transcriptional regulator with XRE-family HTH domain
MKPIGIIIQAERERLGIKQGILAQKVGISQTFLSQVENGNKNLSFEKISKICKELRIPISALYYLAIEKEDLEPEKHHIFEVINPTIVALIKTLYRNEY